MDEEMQRKIALFRFGVIFELLDTSRLRPGEWTKLLQEKSERQYEIPSSSQTSIGKSTIMRWLKLYRDGGARLESLFPRARRDRGAVRSIDEETYLGIIELRKTHLDYSIPMFLQEARKCGVIPPGSDISASTLYRIFKRAKLFPRDEKEPVDRRKFEAELPNDIWQSDVMHGPKVVVDNRLRRSFLFAFIDDMSRFIPYAEFHLAETLESFLICFKRAVVSRGVPRKLYVDNGAVYRSIRLQYITASLGIALIHSKPYEPEGRGKIERWFKTVRMQFLPTCPREITLEELNRRLEDYVHDYNTRIHSSINTTPIKRYLDHIHVIRQVEKHIDEYFRIQVERTVYKDRSVRFNSMVFEAPLGLAGKKVHLLYHQEDPLRIEVMYQNQSYGFLTPLDLHANVHIRRDRERTGQNGMKRKGEALPGDSPCKGGLLFEQPGEKEDNHD